MTAKVTGALIEASAEQLIDMKFSTTRAAELAQDVDRLKNVALAAAAEGDFNDEPSRFSTMLLTLKAKESRR